MNLAHVVPTESMRRTALDQFDVLLGANKKEAEWQTFFDKNPYVLTESLPLRLDGLYSHVPLVTGIPDYIFHRSTNGLTGDYGVIELKRPDQSIMGLTVEISCRS